MSHHQVEGTLGVDDTLPMNDCEDGDFVEWLREHNLIKFYEPLKDYLGIDSFESCSNLDICDIPRVCQNIPNDVKLQLNISFKDEMILKKQLKLLINKTKLSQQKTEQQQHIIVRNFTEQETIYFDKLIEKEKQLNLLLNETFVQEEKDNEKHYSEMCNKLKLLFDQFHSQLTQMYEKNCEILKNEYETNCVSKHEKMKYDLNNVLKEMEKTKVKFRESIQFDSMDSYIIQSKQLKPTSQENVEEMKQVLNVFESLYSLKRTQKSLENSLWTKCESFLNKSKSEMQECTKKHLILNINWDEFNHTTSMQQNDDSEDDMELVIRSERTDFNGSVNSNSNNSNVNGNGPKVVSCYFGSGGNKQIGLNNEQDEKKDEKNNNNNKNNNKNNNNETKEKDVNTFTNYRCPLCSDAISWQEIIDKKAIVMNNSATYVHCKCMNLWEKQRKIIAQQKERQNAIPNSNGLLNTMTQNMTPKDKFRNKCYRKDIVGNIVLTKCPGVVHYLEAALEFQMGEIPSQTLIDKITQNGANIEKTKQTAAMTSLANVLRFVDRYNDNLIQIEFLQLLKSKVSQLFVIMDRLLEKFGHGISCVIIVSQSCFLIHLNADKTCILVDSFGKRYLRSHCLIFDNCNQCESYLKSTRFKVNGSNAMDIFEASILCLKANNKIK